MLLPINTNVTLPYMILGIEDISGGKEILTFFIWLVLTLLFYLVSYVALLNVVDDITKNSWTKVPAMWGLSIITAGLMNILNYNPLILFFIMLVANFYRLKNLNLPNGNKSREFKVNKVLFYISSYGYICLVLGITHYINFRNSTLTP